MARRSARLQRSQRVFWIVSLVVVLTMIVGLMVSLTPRLPRVTPTPLPSLTPFPTRTPTPELE